MRGACVVLPIDPMLDFLSSISRSHLDADGDLESLYEQWACQTVPSARRGAGGQVCGAHAAQSRRTISADR